MQENVAVFGEALFDLIEGENEAIQAYIGGSPFNVARSFARQGLSCSYLSPISLDRYGDKIVGEANRETILLPDNNRVNSPTSLALVYKNEKGLPAYTLYRQGIADLCIDAEKLIALLPSQLALFHTGSLALVPKMESVLIEVFTFLKAQKCPISIDINVRVGVEESNDAYIKTLKNLLKYANILKVSDEDLELMGYTEPAETVAKGLLSEIDEGMVILTKGEHGAIVYTDSLEISEPVFQPNSFGDTVGAGDTFFSAFLSEMIRNKLLSSSVSEFSLRSTLKFALMAATLNVEKVGCQPPNYAEVNRALLSHNVNV